MRPALAPAGGARLGPKAACLTAVLALVFLASQYPPCGSRAPDLRLPPDLTFADHADESPGPVVFSHATHFEVTDHRCVACHPAPFSILGRHRPLTHDAMNAGHACGACHNGRDATGVEDGDSCTVCHSEGGSR